MKAKIRLKGLTHYRFTSNMKFHTRCGANIKLTDDRTVAERRDIETGYNTSVFSSQPLGANILNINVGIQKPKVGVNQILIIYDAVDMMI